MYDKLLSQPGKSNTRIKIFLKSIDRNMLLFFEIHIIIMFFNVKKMNIIYVCKIVSKPGKYNMHI